jgi:energy-coupling factor transport system substrate-specific component
VGAILQQLLALLAGLFQTVSFDRIYTAGLLVSAPMTALFLGEALGYQFRLRPPWAVRVRRRSTVKAAAVMAMTAALSVVLQTAGSILVLVPGTITFRADAMVRFPFGAIFGMPALWGVMLSNILGDMLAGTWGTGSIAGFVISWWMPYLFYRFYRTPADYSMQTVGA